MGDNSLRENVAALIKRNPVCVLATGMPDGSPHTTVVHYSAMMDPLRLVISADVESDKVRNIQRSSVIAAAIGWSESDWVTMQLRGTAKVLTDPSELADAKRTHYEVHPSSQQFEHDPGTVLLCFTPTWLRYSDLSVDPPAVSEHEGMFT